MAQVNTIQVLWTKPFFRRNPSCSKLTLNSLLTLTAIASVLKNRSLKKNIVLYTDQEGLVWCNSIGLTEYFKIDLNILQEIETVKADWEYYPTFGKSYVISRQTSPFIYMDLDFILFDTPNFSNFHGVAVPFKEIPCSSIYLNKETFSYFEDFAIDKDWDFESPIPNSSFMFVNDCEWLKYYQRFMLEFIQKYGLTRHIEGVHPLAPCLFIDQQLPGFLLRDKCVSLMPKIWNVTDGVFHKFPAPENNLGEFGNFSFHHTWFQKFSVINDVKRYRALCLWLYTIIEQLNPSSEVTNICQGMLEQSYHDSEGKGVMSFEHE